jgi:hypothetical protein
MVVPGGGISLNGERWVSSRPAFLLPVRVLSKLFRRLFLTQLLDLHDADRLRFYGPQTRLCDRAAFQRYLAPVRKKAWVVYAKPPFAGPEAGPICRATLTGSRYRTAGCSCSTSAA